MAHDQGTIAARPKAPDRRIPTQADALVFALKTRAFQLRRALTEAPVKLLPQTDDGTFTHCVAEARSPLWADPRLGEAAMQRGKVHNLRAAARRLDRTALAPGAVFSFWAQLGRATRSRGFAHGRMLQEGCLVASTGGGLCQVSNALYDVALQTGCEIIERHAHSRSVPGSAAATGRDATVAWNYVDFRFRSPRALMLRVRLTRDTLIVRLYAETTDAVAPNLEAPARTLAPLAHDCATCGETSCFRHGEGRGQARGARAFVVDEYWPEFDEYIASVQEPGDVLCAPLDARFRRANYAWRTHGLKTRLTPLTTLLRAQRSRSLAAQGAARQTALLEEADRLAARWARGLNEDVTDVCVALPLLPYLWREGHLGGRRFAVLMTRLPLAALQAKLDVAARGHPERRTLSDFRAGAELIAVEQEALSEAAAIITPHTEIANLFGERAVLLPWRRPPAPSIVREPNARRIVFPGPTVARKGAFAVRAAALALDLEVQPLGAEIEGADFWDGIQLHHGEDWLGAAALVQPALIEDKPRRLLRALAAGMPVIATPACGLPAQTGLTLVPEDDEAALIAALREAIA